MWPSLPSMYSALTHCYIGLEKSVAQLDMGDESVDELSEALGEVWCEEELDVVDWRVNVLWQQEANLKLDVG